VVVERHAYTITRRGNDVVHIDPLGTNYSLYQRGHHRVYRTALEAGKRFVPEQEIRWT